MTSRTASASDAARESALLALLGLAVLRPALADGWAATANTMTDPRWAPAYTLLAGGTRGLIAGGYSFPTDRCVATADEFDPLTRRFVPCAGRLARSRATSPRRLCCRTAMS